MGITGAQRIALGQEGPNPAESKKARLMARL